MYDCNSRRPIGRVMVWTNECHEFKDMHAIAERLIELLKYIELTLDYAYYI